MEKKLYLIDGHSLVFKMYYAFLRRPMINSKGADMSILFGFTKYILEMIEREQPTHMAVSFDPPGGTFRNEMYPEYKATRQATPQLIIDALEPLTELCQALNLKVLTIPGYEADDVIGTLALKAAGEGYTVYMVTPDKDYGQLVRENVLQYKPGKAGSDKEILGPAEICAKYGIHNPLQVIDMLTICGDTADNVPGVKGVGEVGAGKLIAKYGSVDAIYGHLDELSPKQREAFESASGHIALSRDLVTIRTDVPLPAGPDEMALDDNYSPEVADLFEKYEFGSLTRFISHVKSSSQKQEKHLSVTLTNAEDIILRARQAGKCSIVLDCTDTGIFSDIRTITVGVAATEALRAVPGKAADAGKAAGKAAATEEGAATEAVAASGSAADFAPLLQDSTVTKVGYDLKKQRNILHHNGINLSGTLQDIELMHYLIDPEKSHRLDILCKSYLGCTVDTAATEPRQSSLSLFDQADDTPEDHSTEAGATALLADRLAAEISERGLDDLYYGMEEPLIRVLSDMEMTGVKVDLHQLKLYAAGLSSELEGIAATIREMAGEPNLNILSTKQIGEVLFEKLALDPKVKKAASNKRYAYSTDEETLTALADRHPIVNLILEYRGIRKLLSTYIDPFPEYVSPATGKIHTTFNQALTATGRLSSSKPNLQNIPIRTERGREIRKAFIPSSPDGVIMSADYSQIELRIMAHLSGDRHLLEAFRAGMDVHAMTAAKIFGITPEEVTPDQRRIAKTANFGIMYGISAFGLAQRLKIPRPEAKKIIDDYFANFPDISSFIDRTVAQARENGYVETLFGRRRYLPDINSRNATVRSLAERNAVNAPIQGTSADIIKKAMTGVARRMAEAGLQSRMVLQVHDELVFDALESEVGTLKEIVVDQMQNVIQLSIPLIVECNYGKNWLEAH